MRYYNLWDYVSSELIHNKTYAHRLPPTFIEQARGLADFRENLIFSDPDIAGIGNIASRTGLSAIINALQRIAFNGDPLQFMLIETTYQPFISLFHQTEIFKNGTHEDFETLHVFGHHEDIPLTEFIYRLEGSLINSNREWAKTCGVGSTWPELTETASAGKTVVSAACGIAMAFVLMFGVWLIAKSINRFRRRNYVCLQGEEELQVGASPATIETRNEKTKMLFRN
ncbi:hypothetical protein AcW1_005149 [Taiwanofungus camphoratus]|nr:hypothetical protein AcW1_005149 [Antrodia cinnamomea]